MNKFYMALVFWFRKVVLILSFIVGGVILLGYDILPVLLPSSLEYFLWKVNSVAIFIVMIVRPLSNLFPSQIWLKFLIPMRKELGIFSAIIVVGFGMAKYMSWGWVEFFTTYFSYAYWNLPEPSFWAHLGELVGVPLLLTSNLLSQKLLKKYWKMVQKLAYVYFYSGAYYVYVAFGSVEELYFMGIVTLLTVGAFVHNYYRCRQKKNQLSR